MPIFFTILTDFYHDSRFICAQDFQMTFEVQKLYDGRKIIKWNI